MQRSANCTFFNTYDTAEFLAFSAWIKNPSLALFSEE